MMTFTKNKGERLNDAIVIQKLTELNISSEIIHTEIFLEGSKLGY